jgi:class 3 adenylate cyclase
MDVPAEGSAAPADPPDERRHLTVVFSDLVGSTELTSTLDPEDFHDLIEAYQNRISAVVSEHGGTVSQFQGDGMVAYFGYPEAHESSSRDAVDAGLSIVAAVAALGDSLPPRLNVGPLEARVGIHTGTMVVAAVRVGELRRPADAFGEVPNLAARLQASGQPGTVVISDATAELVAGFFELESLGQLELKGISRLVPTFGVMRRSGARTRLEARPLSRFIPRSDASAWLHEQWRAVREGAPRLVLLTGDPGIGKSRLLHEFSSELADQGHAAPVAYCTRRNALSPLQPFGLLMGEVPVSPALAASWVGAQAEERPALFVVEDVHWADPSTIEAADLVARTNRPVLVVMTARPEVSDNPQIRPVEQLALDRLSPEAALAVVAGVPGAEQLSTAALDTLVLRADGVPLFLEELTRGMIEHTSEAPEELAVPVTLAEVISARLDRLGEAKQVAQLAAIVGRTFDRSILQAVSGLDDDALDHSIRRLIEHAVVNQAADSEEQLWFRHALIHEAAYGSVLRPLRRQAHAKVGEALLAAGRDQSQPEVVAFHLGAADRVPEAVVLWQRASGAARRHARYREAASHERELLALLPHMSDEAERDRRELASRNRLIMCLAAVDQSAPEVSSHAVRIHELALRLSDHAAMLRSYMVLIPWWQANVDYAALELALPEAKGWARQLEDTTSAALLEHLEGTVRIWQGRLGQGLEQMTQSYAAVALPLDGTVSTLPDLPGPVILMTVAPRIATALGCWLSGQVALAHHLIDDLERFVASRAVPQATAVAAATAAIIAQLDGDRDLTAMRAAVAVRAGDEVTTQQWKQWGTALLWWAGAGKQQPELPAAFLRPYLLLLRADDPQVAPEQALAWLDEALETGRATSEQFCEAEILRVRGSILAGLGRLDAGVADLDEAAQVAAVQGCRMLEIKALTDRLALGDDEATRQRLIRCLAAIDDRAPSMVLSRAIDAVGLARGA